MFTYTGLGSINARTWTRRRGKKLKLDYQEVAWHGMAWHSIA